MLQIIVFSFNRAIQLDALLTSFQQHWHTARTVVDVIYNTSSDPFQEGYNLLIRKWQSDRMRFHKESPSDEGYSFSEIINPRNLIHLWHFPKLRHPRTDFRHLMIDLMNRSEAHEVMFLTDDSLFTDDVVLPPDVFSWINESPRHRQFSLRLGKGMNQPPQGIRQEGSYIVWNFSDAPEERSNWGYHFSVDAHIYSKEVILYLYKKYIFINPNSLEGYICACIRSRRWLNQGRCFLSPKLLSFPINIVQDFNVNESMNCSPETMNSYFLNGYVLNYPVPDTPVEFQQYPPSVTLVRGDSSVVLKTM